MTFRPLPSLWSLLLTVMPLAAQSPRGAETFATPTAAVVLAWDASVGGADGYRVYVRKSGENYSSYTDTGTNRSLRIGGLARKTTYRTVVTAYKGTLESKPSAELSFRTSVKGAEQL